jgi:hypothetical protein
MTTIVSENDSWNSSLLPINGILNRALMHPLIEYQLFIVFIEFKCHGCQHQWRSQEGLCR